MQEVRTVLLTHDYRGECPGLRDTPLITVIVPIYQVEIYLRDCVDSILAQTYANLEVILVDDGSPDGCPQICDEYASIDRRVRVIHKANGGLSDARNAGLDVARGEWIGFVDSDDMVEPAMFETLLAQAQAHESQISVCNFAEFADGQNEREALWTRGVQAQRVLSGREACCLLMVDDELQNYAWNKLYAARLWDGVRFPVGQKYEDVNTTYKLFEKADRAVLIPEVLYWYRLRENSIVGSRSLAGEFDCVQANLERCEDVLPRIPEAAQPMIDGVMKAILNLWPLAWEYRRDLTPRQRELLGGFSEFAAKHAPQSTVPARLGITGRLTYKLLAHPASWSQCCAYLLDSLYRLKHDGRTR